MLEFEKPNSAPKASSRGESCLSFIYSNVTLFLVDVGLGFFPTILNSKKIKKNVI